jgi:hypothetical protein
MTAGGTNAQATPAKPGGYNQSLDGDITDHYVYAASTCINIGG